MKWLDKFIVSERGQWDHPGKPTAVPTKDGRITMQGVPYPVFAMDETGYGGMIYPGGNYQFPGKMVYEIPMAQYGNQIKKSIVSAEELPEDAFPYEGTSAMFKDERYNIDRAKKLYTEDEFGHLPSIDYETGEWLKAKRYPTSWKEFLQYALNPEVNKLGFPTENKEGFLKYPNYAYGGDISIPDLSRPKWLEKYQDGSQVKTYATDPNYFNNRAVFVDNPQANELVRSKIYAGTHGWDPTTNSLVKLDKPVAVPEAIREMSTADWGKKSSKERFESDTPAGKATRKAVAAREMEQAVTNPYFRGAIPAMLAAPAIAAAGPSVLSALNTPAVIGSTTLPGVTAGNIMGAGFAADALVNRLPQIPGQLSKGEYLDAAINAATGALDLYGANMVSPLYKGAKAATQKIGKGIASRALNKKNSNIVKYDENHPLGFLGAVETNLLENDYAKFVAENPNAKVVRENWGDIFDRDKNRFYDISRSGQQQAFDEATDFGYRWTLKNPKKHDELMSMIRKIEEDKSKATLESSKKISAFNDWAKSKGYLDDFGIFEPPSPTAPGRPEFMSKWKESKEAIEKINLVEQMNRDKIMGLHKKLDENIDSSFRKRVENIYSAAESRMPESSGIQYLASKDKNKLVYIGEDESMQNLSNRAKTYLANQYKNIQGVRINDTGEIITLASKPEVTYKTIENVPFRYGDQEFIPKDTKSKVIVSNYNEMTSPTNIGETAAHEFGHEQQNLWNDWVNIVDEYNPNFGYYTKSKDNPLAKRLTKAMIDPKPMTESDIANNKTFNYDTWLGAFRELNSEMQKARYMVARHYMKKHGLTLDDAVTHIKAMEDSGRNDLFDFYLTEGKVDKHFKPSTPLEEKRSILKEFIPVAAPLTIAAGSAAAMKKEKYGGWLDNY